MLPVAPVYDMAQALENPYLREIGMLRNTPHPRRDDLRTFANPIKLDGNRLPGRVCSALGGDNAAIFGELGLGAAELAQLTADGVL